MLKNKVALLFLLGTMVLGSWSAALAQPERKKVLEGNKLYGEEKFDEAFLKYRDAAIENPELPAIHYNMANALYKKKNYDESVAAYEKSLTADDVLSQANTYYNLGNVMYRQNKMLEAIQYYQKALKLNPDDQDAKYNLEYVRRKIKNEADKQKQNPNQQQQQNQQDQQQQQQSDQQKQEQQSQEQKEQEQKEQEQEQKQQEQEQQGAEPQQLSKEDAERILQALEKDEKDAREKDKKPVQVRGRLGKDW